jgi:hypothetical protein
MARRLLDSNPNRSFPMLIPSRSRTRRVVLSLAAQLHASHAAAPRLSIAVFTR